MVSEQHLVFRHAGRRLPAEVKDDLEQLARVDALMQSPRQVGRQCASEALHLFIPVAGTRLATCFSHSDYPPDDTSPFSRTGFATRTASSLTNRSCVSNTVNPRPRRASIMCES